VAVTACVPKSVGEPEIIGVPQVGRTLFAYAGEWQGVPTAFTYTWSSCAASDSGQCYTRQEGADPTYVVRSKDEGRRLRVIVKGANQDGSATAESDLTAAVAPGQSPSGDWEGWATSPDHARSLGALAVADEASTVSLTVDPATTGQTWLGVGGAMTDASVSLIERAGPGLTSALFDADSPDGARLGLVRLPLSATDFSTRAWTWQDNPVLPPAPTVEAARAIAAVHAAALVRPDLEAVGASWSAPAWMKTTGSLNGGVLSAGRETAYGDYLVAEATLLRAAGVPLAAVSLGNEPGHSSFDYPTMVITDGQMIALGQAVGPRLDALGVDLWALDHNWSDRGRLDAVLAGAPGAFDAAAFHCYSGQPSSMGGLSLPSLVTECTGGEWDPSWASTFRWQARNLVVDPVANGSTGLLLWNLALDPSHGPHTGGCGDCRGLVTVDPATGQWTPGPEYYLLAHVSRAADRDAVRVGLSSSAGSNDVPAVAFANPDGSIGIFGHNASSVRQVIDVALPSGTATRVVVQPGELFTLRGPAPAAG
jgi:glucosylceramidase